MDELEKYHLEHKEETIKFLNSDSFKRISAFTKAEDDARRKAGIQGKKGEIEFICPLCGGVAISQRYPYKNELHGGSQCSVCKVGSKI